MYSTPIAWKKFLQGKALMKKYKSQWGEECKAIKFCVQLRAEDEGLADELFSSCFLTQKPSSSSKPEQLPGTEFIPVPASGRSSFASLTSSLNPLSMAWKIHILFLLFQSVLSLLGQGNYPHWTIKKLQWGEWGKRGNESSWRIKILKNKKY